jgi:uncharacterized protein
MVKPIGSVCNLNCAYCYYLEKSKLYSHVKDFRMTESLMERYVEQYIITQNVPEISFVWQGGEPTLMGIDFYKKVLDVQQKYAGHKKISNVFQTNATTLTDEWCSFFHDNNFLIGVSIDGPKKYHDHFRVTKTGELTFDKVMQGIAMLKKHKTEFNTLTVVNSYNVDYPLEVYRFLKEIGSGFMQFLPVVEYHALDADDNNMKLVNPGYKGKMQPSPWTVEPDKFGKFLCGIFDEWVRNDVGKYYVQLFDVTLANWVGEMPGLCVFAETCGDAVVMEHNGDIYSCDHYVYPEYYLGNIVTSPMLSMVKAPKQLEFGSNKLKNLPAYCIGCDVRFACHGECPKHRFLKTPYGEPGLAYLCESYKMFFHHVWPHMDFMAEQFRNKQAPANIMYHLREKEGARQMPVKNTLSNISRNDSCPCGSGKKYKNCCGQ